MIATFHFKGKHEAFEFLSAKINFLLISQIVISALLAASMCPVITVTFPGIQMVKSGLKMSGKCDVIPENNGSTKKKMTV